jgi:hypothetical protein
LVSSGDESGDEAVYLSDLEELFREAFRRLGKHAQVTVQVVNDLDDDP